MIRQAKRNTRSKLAIITALVMILSLFPAPFGSWADLIPSAMGITYPGTAVTGRPASEFEYLNAEIDQASVVANAVQSNGGAHGNGYAALDGYDSTTWNTGDTVGMWSASGGTSSVTMTDGKSHGAMPGVRFNTHKVLFFAFNSPQKVDEIWLSLPYTLETFPDGHVIQVQGSNVLPGTPPPGVVSSIGVNPSVDQQLSNNLAAATNDTPSTSPPGALSAAYLPDDWDIIGERYAGTGTGWQPLVDVTQGKSYRYIRVVVTGRWGMTLDVAAFISEIAFYTDEKVPPVANHVTYNANTSVPVINMPENGTKHDGAAYTILGTTGSLPIRTDGYIFTGWAVSPDGAVAYPAEQVHIYNTNADLDLYAIWEEADILWTVSYREGSVEGIEIGIAPSSGAYGAAAGTVIDQSLHNVVDNVPIGYDLMNLPNSITIVSGPALVLNVAVGQGTPLHSEEPGNTAEPTPTERPEIVAFPSYKPCENDTGECCIDYSEPKQGVEVIVPGSVGGAEINLTLETISLGGFAPSQYNIGNGKWKSVGNVLSDKKKFAKLLNKGMTLSLRDAAGQEITFPQINPRPRNPRLSINYSITEDKTGASPGAWVLAEKSSLTAAKEKIQIAVSTAASKGKEPNEHGWGKFYPGDTSNGICVKPLPDNNKVGKTAYIYRIAPSGNTTEGYSPASKQRKVNATSELRKPNIRVKIKEKKGSVISATLRVKKGMYVRSYFNRIGEETLLPRAEKYDISMVQISGPVEVWMGARPKKSASAKNWLWESAG
ncbi:MAG: InlB B-repeat-containing protein [Oscillospiraceae bacterium]|nr:InlB B-repeat-containing protein [Oscillospiraceae bacterium]